jgi:ribonuclease HII
MSRAVRSLACRADHVLVDGNMLPPGLPCPAEAIVSGDALSLSIAAASIVAKVTRDRLMISVGRAFPDYGFERHMGYSTPAHFDALDRHGPCEHHRRSFAPIRAALGLEAVTGDLFGEGAFAGGDDEGVMPAQVALTDQPTPTVIPAKAGTQ